MAENQIIGGQTIRAIDLNVLEIIDKDFLVMRKSLMRAIRLFYFKNC